MNKRAVLFTLATLVASAPAAAQNAPYVPGSDPVSINACGPMISDNSSTTVGGIALTGTSTGIRIQFTNNTPKTANLINFAVKSNGASFVIRDVGTFSPGIEITHKFRNGSGQSFALPAFITPQIKCSIDSVHFTDGSVWTKDQPAVFATPEPPKSATSAVLTATPTAVSTTMKAGTQYFMVTSAEEIAGFSERNSCNGIASVRIVASGGASATYSVKPLAQGACAATIQDEDGHSLTVPINVH